MADSISKIFITSIVSAILMLEVCGMIFGGWGFSGKRKVPYESKVEYIESTGTQWIDTLYSPNPMNFGYVCEAMFFNDLSGTKTIAGCWGPSWSTSGYCFSFGGNYRGGFGASNKNWRGGDAYGSTIPRINVGEKSLVSVVNQNDEIDGKFHVKISSPLVNETVLFDYPYSGSSQINTFAVFGIKTGTYPGSIKEIPHARIYGIKLLEYSNVVMDLIPVRVLDGGTSVGCLYDRKNPTGGSLGNGLYPNQGNGNGFLIGDDI